MKHVKVIVAAAAAVSLALPIASASASTMSAATSASATSRAPRPVPLIQSRSNATCIDVRGGRQIRGTEVGLWPCNSRDRAQDIQIVTDSQFSQHIAFYAYTRVGNSLRNEPTGFCIGNGGLGAVLVSCKASQTIVTLSGETGYFTIKFNNNTTALNAPAPNGTFRPLQFIQPSGSGVQASELWRIPTPLGRGV